MDPAKRKYLMYLGYVEGLSLLVLLFIAMPLKYFAGLRDFSRITGTVHGCLFLMYIVALITNRRAAGFRQKHLLIGMLLSCLPFGPFYFESWLQKNSDQGKSAS